MHTISAITVTIMALLVRAVLSSYLNSTYHLPPLADAEYKFHVKRWYSVKEMRPPMELKGWGPWPLMCPDTESQTQPVRYCFADSRSETNLQSIVDEAVARWAHAIVNSALEIDFDDQESTVCSASNRDDALVISDMTRDGDNEFNWEHCDTQSTTGYDYSDTRKGRHFVRFCHSIPGYETKMRDAAVRVMMHELGHVIGLSHEHQRNDRANSIYFKCKNLKSYKQGMQAADIDEQALFDDDTDDPDKINLICNDEHFAAAYLPAALPFIRGGYMDDTKWSTFVTSQAFDFDSIMIYNSYSGSVDEDDPKKWVLVRKDNKTPVWMGGNEDPTKASVSAGDIARVAQLYPKRDGSSEQAMDADNWGPVNVKIRGVFERVVYPPNEMAVNEL